MSIRTWLGERIGGGSAKEIPLGDFIGGLTVDAHARELAFHSAVRLITGAISKCEFKTYTGGTESKNPEYFLWNLEPNVNQSASEFVAEWIAKLYYHNECLIIERDGQLIIADSYTVDLMGLQEYRFENVSAGGFTFHKPYSMRDVLYFKIGGQNVRALIDGIYAAYGKLLSYSMREYQRSKGSRGVLKVSGQASGAPDFQETVEKLMNKHFKTFFTANNAVLPLFDGYEYVDEGGKKTYSAESTRDIRAIVDDIFDFTARMLCIPPVLLRGDVANTSWAQDNFLSFCIDPLASLLQREINRKRYGSNEIKKGNYLAIDTSAIKHIDILSMASAADKLISSGVFSINDILHRIGREPINETWADAHFITKNYSLLMGGGLNRLEETENDE